MTQREEAVQKYFDRQNTADAEGIVALFADDSEVYNANFPPVQGKPGVRGFCEGLYARTSARRFECLEVLVGGDTIMAEWKVKMTFRAGAKIGPFEIERPFDVELRGVNKFEFLPGSNLVRCLRTYHETTTVTQKAQANAKAA